VLYIAQCSAGGSCGLRLSYLERTLPVDPRSSGLQTQRIARARARARAHAHALRLLAEYCRVNEVLGQLLLSTGWLIAYVCICTLYVGCNCTVFARARVCVCVPDISRYGMCILRLRVIICGRRPSAGRSSACVTCHAARESTLQLNFRRPFQISRVSVAAEPKRGRTDRLMVRWTSTGTGLNFLKKDSVDPAPIGSNSLARRLRRLLSPFGEASENPGENCTPFRASVSERMSSEYLQPSLDDPSATRF